MKRPVLSALGPNPSLAQGKRSRRQRALAKPGYAIPFRYLGEAQEKKGLKREAIKSYTQYLDLYPRAEDKEKIQKKIDKLRKEVKSKKS